MSDLSAPYPSSNVSPMLGRTSREQTAGSLRATLEQARASARLGATADARKMAASLGSSPIPSDEGTRDVLTLAAALDARLLFVQGTLEEAQSRSRSAASELLRLSQGTSTSLVAEDHRDIGIALYLAGGHDVVARAQLERAADMAPQDGETWFALGLTLRRLEHFAEAAVAFRRSLEQDGTRLDAALALVESLERAGSSDDEKAAAYAVLAGAHYARGHFKEAADACEHAVRLHPTTNTYLGYGTILVRLRDYAGALDKFDRAIQLDPKNYDACSRKGEALRVVGRLEEAVAVLKTVPPDAGEAYTLALGSLAASYGDLKLYREAEAAVEAALELDPWYYFGLLTRASLFRGEGRIDEAVDAYRRVVAAYPTSREAPLSLAEALQLKGSAEESLEVIEGLLAVEPNDSRALAMKAGALKALGRPEEALAALDQALRTDPDYAYALDQKADIYIARQERDKAIEVLQRLVELQPDSSRRRSDLAEQLRGARRFDESLKVIETVLVAEPHSVTARGTKAADLIGLGRPDEALVVLDEALERKPDDVFCLEQKASAHLALGDQDKAIATLQRLVELRPDQSRHRIALADRLQLAGRYDECLAQVDLLLEAEPTNVRAFRVKGDALMGLGRYDGAIAALDLALEQAPDDPIVIATKGQVFAAMGHHAEAVAFLRRGIEEAETQAARGRTVTITWAIFDLAENLRVLRRWDEALRAYDDLLELEPDSVDALGGKGAVLFALERYDEALSLLDRSLALTSDYVFGLTIKAALLASAGELERSAELGARVSVLEAPPGYSLLVYGFVLSQLGRHAEAERILLRAIETDEDDLMSRGHLGDVYRATGRSDEATRAYRDVITRAGQTTDPDRQATVGWAWFRLADYDRAVQVLSDAVARGRLMAHAQFDLGLALLCSGRGELAQGEYERGVEMSRTQHHPWRQHGLLQFALADIDAARRGGLLARDTSHADTVRARLQAEFERTPGIGTPASPHEP